MAASAHRDFPDLIPPSTRVRTIDQAAFRRGLIDTAAVLDLGSRCPHPAQLRGPTGCVKAQLPTAFSVVWKSLVHPSGDLAAQDDSVEHPQSHQGPHRRRYLELKL